MVAFEAVRIRRPIDEAQYSRGKGAHSPKVSGDVVADHQAHGKEEPEYPTKNVVGNELDLRDNHADRDDGPRQLPYLHNSFQARKKRGGGWGVKPAQNRGCSKA